MREIACDVAVVGAGPGGIAAAVTAADHACRTVLLDEAPRPGGQIWRHRTRAMLARDARDWLDRLERSSVQLLCGASAFDAGADPLHIDAETAAGRVRVSASRAIILATGAREIFLPFAGWTLPGVIGVGAAQALMKAGLEVRGQRVIVAGTGPLLLSVAAMAAAAGADVRAVLEQAPGAAVRRFALGLWTSPPRLLAAARYRAAFARTRYETGTWVVRANGDARVAEAVITNGRTTRTVTCDLLCVAYGLTPATELARLLGCAVGTHGVTVDDAQRTSVSGVYCVGESVAVAGASSALLQGQIAGHTAAGSPPPRSLLHPLRREHQFARRLDSTFRLRPELTALAQPDTIVCRCEDVTHGSLAGFRSAREAKLQTRAGMGACQGRICGAALDVLFDWPRDSVRPPLLPVPVGMLADADSADPPRR